MAGEYVYTISGDVTEFTITGETFNDTSKRGVHVLEDPTDIYDPLSLTISGCTFNYTWEPLIVDDRNINLIFCDNEIYFTGTIGSQFKGVYVPYRCLSAKINNNIINNAYYSAIFVGGEGDDYEQYNDRTGKNQTNVEISGNVITNTWSRNDETVSKDSHVILTRGSGANIVDNYISGNIVYSGVWGVEPDHITRQLAGIYAAGPYITCDNNTVIDGGTRGIMVKSPHQTILNNDVRSYRTWSTASPYLGEWGISVSHADEQILNNTVSGYRYAFYNETSSGNITYSGNVSYDPIGHDGNGACYYANVIGHDVSYYNNYAYNGYHGFDQYIRASDSSVDQIDTIVYSGNQIYHTGEGHRGMWLYLYDNLNAGSKLIEDIRVLDNIISGYDIGLRIAYSTGWYDNIYICSNDYADCSTDYSITSIPATCRMYYSCTTDYPTWYVRPQVKTWTLPFRRVN